MAETQGSDRGPKGTWNSAGLVSPYFSIEHRTFRPSGRCWAKPSRPRRLQRKRQELQRFFDRLGWNVVSDCIEPRERAGKAIWEA